MKKLFFLLLIVLHFVSGFALNINIIESQSFNPGHTMDNEWYNLVTGMGHVAVISPQTILDNTTFFGSTDILIVSSGVITLPANRITTILQFIQSGKPVYIQSEYDSTFTSNQAFSFIVNSVGGNFSWDNDFVGDLNPMNVLGTYATTNLAVPPLSYYWYSVSGSDNSQCSRLVNILEYGGEYHGFQYVPANAAYGSIITTTDQDWINTVVSTDLMENFITHLVTPPVINSGNIALDLGNDTTICPGSSFILDAGSGNVLYQWQNNSSGPTFTVTQPGTYWVNVTNGACSVSDTIDVTLQPGTLINSGLFLGQDTTLCNPPLLLDANVQGAQSFLWSTGATTPVLAVSGNGTYSVQVNFPNCTFDTDTIAVSFNGSNVPLVDDTEICKKGSVTLQAPPGYNSYLWSDGSTGTTFTTALPGMYALTVTLANGCVYTDSVEVVYLPYGIPAPGMSWAPMSVQGNVYINQFNSISSGFNMSYLWDFGNGITSTMQNPIITLNCGVSYPVMLVVYNECGGDTTYQTVLNNCTTDISGSGAFNAEVSVYPQPASESLTIRYRTELFSEVSINLCNLPGQIVKSWKMQAADTENLFTLSLNGVTEGVYSLVLISNQKQWVIPVMIR